MVGMFTKTADLIISGQLKLDDVPEEMNPAMRNLISFWAYTQAVKILELPRDNRTDEINKIHENLRGLVKDEIIRVFNLRKSKNAN